jgi:hypothetical protein
MKPKFRYRIHKKPPLIPILSHTTMASYFKIHFNYILLSMPASSHSSFSFLLSAFHPKITETAIGIKFLPSDPKLQYQKLKSIFSYILVSQSYTHSIGLLGRGISQSQGRYIHTGEHEQNKTVHALDITTTVIASSKLKKKTNSVA